ncbi:hypothetical protein JOE44_002074 [Chryseobacterium sp. PvR013]|nr:hypothetical protein [Chryseobacterium sp. PvR013]
MPEEIQLHKVNSNSTIQNFPTSIFLPPASNFQP